MTGQAITVGTLLRARRAHLKVKDSRKKKEVRPTHTLVDAFYAQVSRAVTHPIIEHVSHQGWECVVADFTIDHGWAARFPALDTLRIDLPPHLTRELVPAGTPAPTYDWTAMNDRQIIVDEAAWPDWPRLYVVKPDGVARGGTPFGWVVAGDKPRGGTIRVKRPGTDQNIPYRDVTSLLAMGWRVRRST